MLAYSIIVFLGGFTLFLLGFAVFMRIENRKFGDNQFTMKLLPPPPRLECRAMAVRDDSLESAVTVSDWTAVPEAVPDRSTPFAALPEGAKALARTR